MSDKSFKILKQKLVDEKKQKIDRTNQLMKHLKEKQLRPLPPINAPKKPVAYDFDQDPLNDYYAFDDDVDDAMRGEILDRLNRLVGRPMTGRMPSSQNFLTTDTFKPIVAKMRSKCPTCAATIEPGNSAYWRPLGGGTICANCYRSIKYMTPPNAVRDPTPVKSPEPAPRKLIQSLTDASTLDMAALVALERAVIDRAERKLTETMEADWNRYNKLKAMALSPGSSQEGKTALRMALLKLIDLVYG